MVGLSAASRLRVTPPIAVNVPPMYTAVSVTTIARTLWLTFGANVVINCAGGGVVGGDPVAGRAVGVGELATDVDP